MEVSLFPKLLILHLDYDEILIEELLQTLGTDKTQEQILNYIIDVIMFHKSMVVLKNEEYTKSIIDLVILFVIGDIQNEVKDSYKKEILQLEEFFCSFLYRMKEQLQGFIYFDKLINNKKIKNFDEFMLTQFFCKFINWSTKDLIVYKKPITDEIIKNYILLC